MADNDFRFDAVAGLKETESQKQVKKDIKSFLSNIKIPLIGTLSSKTKAQLMKDIASLNGTVDLTGKVNSKAVASSLQQATAQAQKQADAKPIEVSFAVKKEKLINDVKLLAQQNSRLFKNSDMSIKYNSLLDNAEMAKNTVELSTLRTQLGSFRSELKITGNAGLTMTDALKNGLSKVLQLFGSHGIIVQFTAQLRKAWTEAKELDQSMTDLSRVNAEITRSGFPDYLDKVISKTKQLAVATKDYIDSVTTFSRAGYNLADSETLADAAVQLEKVGDMSAVDASKALLAGLQGYAEIGGYGMDQLAEKAQALNDRIDKIGNTASISQEEVARGIQAVGSVMSDANTSVDEFIALLGAGNRAVQDSDKVALAIRTSALRIRGCTADLQEMGEETDSVIESTSTLAEKIKALTNIDGSGGVNILEADEETFRSIYDIYNDIARVYDKMSDKDASALLDLIAGKNRSNQISAILQNMSEANELLEKSLNAAGTASEEYEIYLNSAEAASERFGVAMTEAYSKILNGETVKGLTNTGAAVLELANSWNILEGTIKGFLALGILKGVTTLTVAFKNSALQISNYGKALNAVKQVSVDAQGTEDYARAMDTLTSSCVNLTDAQLKQVLANRNLSDAQLIEILQLDTLEKEQTQARLAQLGLIQTTETQTVAQGAATVSTFSLSAAIKGLGASIKAAFMANPIGVTIMGISLAFSVISTVISKYKESVVEADEATKEAIETFETISSEVETLENKLSELNDQIRELDPITDAEDIENLKAETEELNTQLAILKEKQRIAGADADKAAQKSLGMTEASRYKTEERESAYGGVETGASYVTKDEELLNAIEAYDEYKAKVDEANDSLANMAETGEYTEKEWEEQEQIVSKYSDKMDDARAHANELAVSLDEQKQGLDGNTDASQTLLTKIDDVITKYDQWLDRINGTTEALEEQEEAEKEVSETAKSISFEDAWADSFTSENEAVKELGNTLLDLAEKGRLTKETFNEADSIAGDYFKNLGISADEAVSKINKLVDESSQLSSMSSQISSMAEALGTKLENGFVSADTLSGFDVEVRGLESWDRFQSLLGSTTSSYQECQEAANALATEWVNSSDFLAQLTEQNEEYYKTQLEAMGIENYEELISYAHDLNEAKEVLSQSSLELGNATYDEIEALIAEGAYSELTANMILALYDAKIAEQAVTLDTAADCQNLIDLAGDTDTTSKSIQLLIQLMEIYNNLESGTYDNNAIVRGMALAKTNAIKAQLEALANGEVKDMEIEPTVKLGSKGKSSAKSAGKKAGDAYKDGLKEELSDLDSVISGVTKAIDRQISSIRSQKEIVVASIDAQIDALNEQKSALEDQKKALEEERDARIEIIEQQKKQLELAIKAIDKQIKAKEKIIKGIQDEIDAMRDANEQRKLQNTLMKEQYELERLQHQRTILQYSAEKGMFYTQNTRDIRSQKDKVDDAKLEIEIANRQKQIDLIQKEIDLLEEKRDAINEQINLLDEQENEIKEYFDKQIKAIDKQIESIDKQVESIQKQREEIEKFYESLIENLEKSKSKYEELTEIVDRAELSAALKKLGIDEEALLNGSEEEFEKLKNAYMNIVFQLNEGNDEVLNSLRELSGYEGTAPSMLEESNTKLGTMNDELGNANTEVGNVNSSLTKTASTTSDVATNVSDVNTNIGETVGLVNNEKGAFDELKQTIDLIVEAINQKIQAIETGQSTVSSAVGSEMANFQLLINKILEVKEKLDAVNDTVATMDRQPIDNLTNAFQLLYDKLLLVSNLLGVSAEGEGAVSGISGAIQALNEISLEEGIIAQFTNLKTAIDSVTAAISGGGSESSEGSSSGGTSGSKGGKQGGAGGKGSEGKGESGGGNSLTGAIKEMGKTAEEIIGEEGAEGDGTVIGEFGSMETAVNDVRDAIGTEGSEGQGGSGSGGETDDTLVGSIEYLGDKTEEEMGESDGDGIIGKFNEFKGVIEEAANHVKSISEGLDEIDGKEVECTITINVKMNGSIPAFASGTVLGNMQIESATYNAQYGKAFASGTIGLKHAEKNALRSEYGQPELTVYPNGTTELTTSPVMSDLPKGTVIYNEEQTKKIMDNKANPLGNAHADGTNDEGWFMLPDGHMARPLREGDRTYELQKAFEPFVKRIQSGQEQLITNAMFEGQKQFEKWTNQITNNTAISNITNNRNVQQPVVNQSITLNCPNVTNNSGVEYIQKELNGLSLRAMQEPLRDY